jgi:putative phosphonate metabolism protein
MTGYSRYAIYYAPPAGAFATATAAWLGWDAATGQPAPHPVLQGLPAPVADLTRAPRKYGFHGTIKAPFRLAQGVTEDHLRAEVAALAARLPAATARGLTLARLKGFLALVPDGDDTEILALGAEVVTALDPLRADLTPAEIARRNPDRLTPRQRRLLDLWGYPYVMEEFRFHLTLTDDLPEDQAAAVAQVLAPWLAPHLPQPFAIDDLCLFGQDAQGRFHLLSRHALTG